MPSSYISLSPPPLPHLCRYQWTILNCRTCHSHKGWCFEATEKNLRPTRFYGLTRPGLVLKSS